MDALEGGHLPGLDRPPPANRQDPAVGGGNEFLRRVVRPAKSALSRPRPAWPPARLGLGVALLYEPLLYKGLMAAKAGMATSALVCRLVWGAGRKQEPTGADHRRDARAVGPKRSDGTGFG